MVQNMVIDHANWALKHALSGNRGAALVHRDGIERALRKHLPELEPAVERKIRDLYQMVDETIFRLCPPE